MSPFLDGEGATEIHYHGPQAKEQTEKGGVATQPSLPRSRLRQTPSEDIYDLICVGFGPASLAIAIALHDALDGSASASQREWRPRVCFLERQKKFSWHSGMLLPGSKMQISFIKDLATLRNPRSEFTFLNYLRKHNRLVQFANLGTFLPSRIEFEDYLQWCASHFTEVVEYGQDVMQIIPEYTKTSRVSEFTVKSLDAQTGGSISRRACNVVIAIGGKPRLCPPFSTGHARVIHSSGYCGKLPAQLITKDKPYHIAVVGSGQSAAEIFNDLHIQYPNARSSMIIRDTALRPSDDSPFVNEIFNPERVDKFYESAPRSRHRALELDRSTNYGVVQLPLLEQIYQDLYQQSIKIPNELDWQHRLLRCREVTKVSENGNSEHLTLTLRTLDSSDSEAEEEFLDVDAVLVATGYTRDAHEEMLRDVEILNQNSRNRWDVGRDYRVRLDPKKVGDDVGIWLQGCNESTHGLSDTLLSILAVRGGELVSSIFGETLKF